MQEGVEWLAQRGKSRTPKKPIPLPISQQQILELAQPLDDYDQSLVFGLYLSGARVSELCQVKTTDFSIVAAPDGNKQVKLWLNTRKKRSGTPFRELPLRSSSEVEERMLACVLRHKLTFERLGRKEMYALHPATIWKKLSKLEFKTSVIEFHPLRVVPNQVLHLYPHFLRHCRATHLVSDYAFGPYHLQQYMGWSSSSPAIVYVKLDWREADRLLRGVTKLQARQEEPADESTLEALHASEAQKKGESCSGPKQEQDPGE